LKKRDEASKGQGTTTDSAEASYRIRVMIKAVKESITRMQEICDKEGRKVFFLVLTNGVSEKSKGPGKGGENSRS
jgi:division protein CdvB (Snf7/Vps24/ESCRT-III family)